MSFAYNAATWIMVIVIAAMLVFVAVEFKMADPQRGANFPGKDYEGRISDGIKASPGLGTTKTKEYK